MSDQYSPDIQADRAHQLAKAHRDDPVAALLPLCQGDPYRWLAVGRQIDYRRQDMSAEQAVASVRADLEAGRL